MKIQYSKEPFDEKDLPEIFMDELEGFAEEFQLAMDKDGFVTGTMTPSDVSSLGYKMLAWYLTRTKGA